MGQLRKFASWMLTGDTLDPSAGMGRASVPILPGPGGNYHSSFCPRSDLPACNLDLLARVVDNHRCRNRRRLRYRPLFERLEVVQLPALIEEGLERAIEAENTSPTFSRISLHPVLFLADWRLRSKIYVDRAVFVRNIPLC